MPGSCKQTVSVVYFHLSVFEHCFYFSLTGQIRRLTGISADPFFLQRITHVVYNYRPDAVHKIGMVQAVHHGTHFFVEVHIALPGPMPLSEAHDIGAQLQHQLETINDIERAFVHLDFDFSRATPCEHKIK